MVGLQGLEPLCRVTLNQDLNCPSVLYGQIPFH